jgi:sugar phosphate isomerase/epimerase
VAMPFWRHWRISHFPVADDALQEAKAEHIFASDTMGQRWLADSIPISKALGARNILLPFFGKGAIRDRAEMERVGDILKEMAPAAEKAGVVLGLEDTLSAEDNARILDRANSKSVGIYYEVGNSSRGGSKPLVPILAASKRIV